MDDDTPEVATLPILIEGAMPPELAFDYEDESGTCPDCGKGFYECRCYEEEIHVRKLPLSYRR